MQARVGSSGACSVLRPGLCPGGHMSREPAGLDRKQWSYDDTLQRRAVIDASARADALAQCLPDDLDPALRAKSGRYAVTGTCPWAPAARRPSVSPARLSWLAGMVKPGPFGPRILFFPERPGCLPWQFAGSKW